AVNRYHKHINSSLLKNEEQFHIPQLSKKQKSHVDYAKVELKNDTSVVANKVKSSHDHQIESNTSSPLNEIDLLTEAKVITFRLRKVISEELFVPKIQTTQIVQRFLAFLNDKTKLIANPGLKAGVSGDTLVVSPITSLWKQQASVSNLTHFIVRRYVATPSGPFLVYPATILDQRFDPTRRDWYMRAVEHPGHIIFTAPYLDSGGAGYVVTISYTIMHPKHNGIKSEVSAVMGIDFTLGYFHKLLLESIPLCNENSTKCFIMDDRGYLIAHPSLVEPTGQGPVEYTHVTHKEPLVANDVLNHKQFVRKNVCNSFGDRTIQRFYHFNTSFDSLLTNFVTGGHCAKYNIASLPETNVFIGITHQICDSATAFCPCSMTDRLCLNCQRMEQTDCECPCECPLEINLCTGRLFDDENKNPSCLPYPEEVHEPSIDRSISASSLPKCNDVDCSSLQNKSDCMGGVGCEWCQLSYDGITPLKEKFCTAQHKCFRGVLGSRSPYAGEISDPILVETTRSTPVALVAVAVLFCFLLFGSTFYYYRHRIHGMPQYFSDIRENNLRMSHLENDTDEIEHLQESSPNVAPNQILLAGFQNAAIISPYRLNPDYRRPPGGDSDHGYSTMTPHEDSEMAGPPFLEPLFISKDKVLPNSNRSVVSTSSRDSSPSPCQRQPQEITVLPKVPEKGPHILAQVQVHVVDVS
ncbi:VWFA and cache domain-containing protein 1-like protein, partial [Leptotrombidium deliense]